MYDASIASVAPAPEPIYTIQITVDMIYIQAYTNNILLGKTKFLMVCGAPGSTCPDMWIKKT